MPEMEDDGRASEGSRGYGGRVEGGWCRDGEGEGVSGTGEPMDPGSGGQASGCGTATPWGRGWTLKELDASKQAFLAVGAETQPRRQEMEEPFTVLGVLGFRLGEGLRLTESGPAAGEESGPATVGQKAVVADPDEALGEDMEEEAATELTKGERLGPGPAGSVVLVAEGDGLVVDLLEPVVGDGDAVSIASKVAQNLLGAIEGRLGVHHPFRAPCLVEETAERVGVLAGGKATVELQPSILEGSGKGCQEPAAEEAAENPDG